MISLKRYLDSLAVSVEEPTPIPASELCAPLHIAPSEACVALLAAFRSSLSHMAESGATTCPSLGVELKRGVSRISEGIGDHPDAKQIGDAEHSLSNLLNVWTSRVVQHFDQKAGEVKDLLLIMARTSESLGQRDEIYVQQFNSVTARLATISGLDDIARMRASIEESARDLKNSVARMAAESKAVVDHLRAEVSTYQSRLGKAEAVVSRDALTGLGSRHSVEQNIQERIDSCVPFSVIMVNIENFRQVNDEHGNFTGDLFLKEFARELRSSCRISDLVARWGGDQFIVVVAGTGTEVRSQSTRLLAWIRRSYHVPGKTGYVNVHLDASAGVAEFRDGDTLHDLLGRADAELCALRKSACERMSA